MKSILGKIIIPQNVHIIEPVGYLDMLKLVVNADLVFTDSGGLQKECFFLKKRCVTLRDETEWSETLENNCNILVGSNFQKIIESEKQICGDFNIEEKFGDGKAAEKILSILEGKYK